jgi:hypothetical protein
MVGNLLLRGMLVGLVAGVLAFAFARTYGEPQVDRAIAFEEQTAIAEARAAGEQLAPEPELVSRGTQANLGLFIGIAVYGAAVGGLFALVFALVQGRFSSLSPRATAALLALAAYGAVVLVPQIKYPANPPAVGGPETIGFRTGVYFVMLAISLAATVGAVALARRLWQRYGGWNACLIAAGAFVVAIAIVDLALPAVNEVPEQFSALVLWRFRVVSLGIHLILWTTIGLLFGYLTERSRAGRFAPPIAASPAAR